VQTKPPFGAILNHAHPLAAQMTCCLLLNEGDGKTPINLATHGRTSAFSSGGTGLIWVTTPEGLALKHDNTGTGDFDSSELLLDTSATPASQTFSILMRVYYVGSSQSSFLRDSTASGGIQLRSETSGVLTLLRAAQAAYTSSTGTVISDAYNTVGCTYDSATSTLTYYINGIAAGTTSTGGTFNINAINLGGKGQNEQVVNGGYSVWCYIWNRALAPGEIAQLTLDPFVVIERSTRQWLSVSPAAPPATTAYMTLNTGYWGTP
jgi:hypothetical protein